MIVRPFMRPKGMRNAPRGGEVFPTGPQPIQQYRQYPPVPPQSGYWLGTARETRADLPVLTGRPYLDRPYVNVKG